MTDATPRLSPRVSGFLLTPLLAMLAACDGAPVTTPAAGLDLEPQFQQAACAKPTFVRSKPHVNVGTIGDTEYVFGFAVAVLEYGSAAGELSLLPAPGQRDHRWLMNPHTGVVECDMTVRLGGDYARYDSQLPVERGTFQALLVPDPARDNGWDVMLDICGPERDCLSLSLTL
jgi:hypothetical protein